MSRFASLTGCRALLRIALCGLASLGLSWPASAQVAVATQHNDNGRTGQNPQETVLTTRNVTVATFGKLFSRAVDGYIYAQPLYVPNVAIGRNSHNVVYVATEHNSVYAFDGDDRHQSAPLWQVNLGPSVPSNDVCLNLTISQCPYKDMIPEIGITGTPVIDLTGSTIYVVGKTKDTATQTYHFQLHALDLASGQEKFGGPVEITATVPGSGSGTSGGRIAFNALTQHNRPGMLLLNGVVYIAFGAVGDVPPWHGWVLAYDASTLQQVAVFNATPNGSSGGFWGGGQGLAGDVDQVYSTTGNGSFDINTGGVDYGDTILKLSTSASLSVGDYFTPDNQSFLAAGDIDLGAGGPLLLPPDLLVVIGKDGILRLVNTSNMGEFNPTFNNDLQEFQVTTSSSSLAFIGAPIYWNSADEGPLIYLWGPGDFLKAYKFVGGQFQTMPVSLSTMKSVAGYSNSIPLSLSSNDSQTGTGIIWASAPMGDASEQTVSGILRAFDATSLKELWNSNQNPARDNVGNYAKFTPPTVANGKVYEPTFSGQLVVYGLNPAPATSISFVQVAAATPQTSTSVVSVKYPLPQLASDLNIVVVGWNDTTSSVASVTDTEGNSYDRAVAPTAASGAQQSIYYARNIAGGSNTVTVTFNGSAASPDIRVLEYAGADTTNPLDVTAAASGNSRIATSGAATTTAANELIFAADTIATGTPRPGPGFTMRIITQHDSDIAEDEIGSTPGTYSATAPVSPSGYWVMQMATFKQ